MKINKYLILSLILIGIIVKLFGLNLGLYDDEANYTFATYAANNLGYHPYYYSPIPMIFLYKVFTNILGLETWVFRLVTLLISTLTIITVYFFTKFFNIF